MNGGEEATTAEFEPSLAECVETLAVRMGWLQDSLPRKRHKRDAAAALAALLSSPACRAELLGALTETVVQEWDDDAGFYETVTTDGRRCHGPLLVARPTPEGGTDGE